MSYTPLGRLMKSSTAAPLQMHVHMAEFMFDEFRAKVTRKVFGGAKLCLSFCVSYRGLADLSDSQLSLGIKHFCECAAEFAEREELKFNIQPIRDRFMLSITITPK